MLLSWAFLFAFVHLVTSQINQEWTGSKFNFNRTEELEGYNSGVNWKSATAVKDGDEETLIMIHETGTRIFKRYKNRSESVSSGDDRGMNFVAYVNENVDGIHSEAIVGTSDCLLSFDRTFTTRRKLLGDCATETLSQAQPSGWFQRLNGVIRDTTGSAKNYITALAFYNSTIYLKFVRYPKFVAVDATSGDVQTVIMPKTIHPKDLSAGHKVATEPLMMDVGDGHLYFWSFYQNEHWFGKVELGLKTQPRNAFSLSTPYGNQPGFGVFQLTGYDTWTVVGFKYWRYHLVFVLMQNEVSQTKVFALDIDRNIFYDICDPVGKCSFSLPAVELLVVNFYRRIEEKRITELRRNVLTIRNHKGEPKVDIMCSSNPSNADGVVQGITAAYHLELSSRAEFRYTGVVAGRVKDVRFRNHWPLDRHLGYSSFKVCYGSLTASTCEIRKNISTIRNRWRSPLAYEEYYFDVYEAKSFEAIPSFTVTTHVSKHGLFQSKPQVRRISPNQMRRFGAPFGFGAEGFLYFSQNPKLNAEPVKRFIFRCVDGKSVEGGSCPKVDISASLARFQGASTGYWDHETVNAILTFRRGTEPSSKAAPIPRRPYKINMLERGFSPQESYRFDVTLKSDNFEETFRFADLRNKDQVRFHISVTSLQAFLQSPNEFHVVIVNPLWSPQVISLSPSFTITKRNEQPRSVALTAVNPIPVEENSTAKTFRFQLRANDLPYFVGSSIVGSLRFLTLKYTLYISLSIEAFPEPTPSTTPTDTTTEKSTLPVEVTVVERDLDANLWLLILLAVASLCLVIVVINGILYYLGVLCYRHRKRHKTRTIVKEAGKLYHASFHDYMAKDIYRLPAIARASATVAEGVLEDDTVRVKNRRKKVSRGIEANMPRSPARTASPALALATSTVVGSDNVHKAKFTGNRLGVTELYGLQDKL